MNIIDEINAPKKVRKYAICRENWCYSEIEFGEECFEYDGCIFCCEECAHEYILEQACEEVTENELGASESHRLLKDDGYNVTEDQMRLEF